MEKTCGKPTRQMVMDYWTILQMRHLISCKFRLEPLRILQVYYRGTRWIFFLFFDLDFIYILLQLTQTVLRSSSKVEIHILPVSHFILCFTFLFIFLSKKSLSRAYEDLTRSWILKYGAVVKIQANPSLVWTEKRENPECMLETELEIL